MWSEPCQLLVVPWYDTVSLSSLLVSADDHFLRPLLQLLLLSLFQMIIPPTTAPIAAPFCFSNLLFHVRWPDSTLGPAE